MYGDFNSVSSKVFKQLKRHMQQYSQKILLEKCIPP